MKKHFIPRLLLTTVCFLGIAASQADTSETTEFSAPAEYCFPQTSLRGEFDKIILDHHVIIPPEDHFKSGDIFVGARFKSQPDTLWLTNGVSWWNADDDIDNPGPKAYSSFSKLQPVIPVLVNYTPADVSAFVGDGEIWVGYGLRSEAETWRESFEEMKSSQRFSLLWEIGVAGSTLPSPIVGLHSLLPTICLTATKMTTTIHVANINPPIESGPDIPAEGKPDTPAIP